MAVEDGVTNGAFSQGDPKLLAQKAKDTANNAFKGKRKFSGF